MTALTLFIDDLHCMLKGAISVSFRSELFTSYIILLTILSSETYARKYVKVPNIVIHACKSITEKV